MARRTRVGRKVVGICLAASAALAGGARADDATVSGFAFGGTGETVFEHTRASLRDPHFGMRVYLAHKVPGTLSQLPTGATGNLDAQAAAAGGDHAFWDVAFGERAPILGWYDVHPTRSLRHARGFQLNADAAAFLLLDFNAQSSAVIDTDYRLGLSGDVRPWADGWDRLSLSAGFYHQSTHLGDEYVLSAQTIQAGGAPAINPTLPYRANPSYIAFPATLSVDLGPDRRPELSARLYGGGTLYTSTGGPGATPVHPDWRVGLELRYGEVEPAAAPAPREPATGTVTKFLSGANQFGLGHGPIDGQRAFGPPGTRGRQLRRGARSYVLAYEVLVQRQYAQDAAAVPRAPVFVTENGHWVTHHVMAMLVFDLDTQRSTSNALAFSLELLDGRNQAGQLVAYDSIRTVALGLSYYW